MNSTREMLRWAGRGLSALGLLISLACGGGGGSAAPTPTPTPTPSFTLFAAPSALSLVQGTTGSVSLSVTPKDGFTGTVTASAANLPTGVTASFNPASTPTSTVVTFTVSAATVPGTYALSLNGVAPGAPSATTTLSLQVTASSLPGFSLALNPTGPLTVVAGSSGNLGLQVAAQNGFTGSVAFSVSGLPTGATGTFTPTSSTSASNLQVAVGAAVAAGTYPFTIKGTSAGVADATVAGSLVVSAAAVSSFSLTQSPAGPLTLVAGTSGSLSVQVAAQNGFAGSVAFSVSGFPTGVTGTFNPASSTSASTLQVTVGAAVAAGTYPFTLKGSSTGVADASLAGSLVVTAGATGATDVYIAGYVGTGNLIAGYWKNGVAVALTDGSVDAVAYAVAVSGSDIYVVGYETDGDVYISSTLVPSRYKVAKLWKNGVATRLTDGKHHADARALVLSGADIYIAGREGTTNYPVGGVNGFSAAKVWKNGVGTALSGLTGYGLASALTVVDGDVYVAGYQQIGNSFVAATYWKNGAAYPLTNGASSAGALGIAVAGGTVYVAGYEEPLGGGNEIAKLWTNGIATVFTNGQSSDAATGVALNGTDVWVTGSIGIQAVVWKNGQALALTSSTDKSAGQLLGLSVSAGSVWFCGVYGSQAAYWDKTGAGWKLTNGTELLSSANGIFVVTH